MIIIGLIGGSGSGKSIICKAGRELGFEVIDADKIGHDIIFKGAPAYDEIVSFFGRDILLDNGEINRKMLGKIVFSDNDKLKELNKITHDKISIAIEDKIAMCDKNVVIIDGAVLYKTDIFKKCDLIIAVNSSVEDRVRNICARDGLNTDEALLRINSQISNKEYSDMADITIQNDEGLEQLFEKSISILREVSG